MLDQRREQGVHLPKHRQVQAEALRQPPGGGRVLHLVLGRPGAKFP